MFTLADNLLPKFEGKIEAVILPTAPKASRPNEIDTSRVPHAPPFKVHIGNIPYDTTEEDIRLFFKDLNLKDIQLPREDKGLGRTRGFGYAEFETRTSMIDALKLDGVNLNNRPLRVSLPDESSRDGDRRDKGSGFGSGYGEEDRTVGDWRKAPRVEQSPSSIPSGPSSRGPPSNREINRDMADSGPWREAGPRISGPPPPSSNYVPPPAGRDFVRNGYEAPPRDARGYDSYNKYDDRRGYSDRGQGYENFGTRSGYSDDRYRRNNYDQGGYRDARPHDDYDRKSGYDKSYDRPPRDYDRGPRDFDRPPADRGYDRPPAPRPQPPPPSTIIRDLPPQASSRPDVVPPSAPEDSAPKERKKLQLLPRTVPKEEVASPAPVSSRSIFGDAKPVDTTKKEKEVEEKLKSLEIKEEPKDAESVKDGRVRTISTSSHISAPRSRKESESSHVTQDQRRDIPPPRRQLSSTSSDHYDRRGDDNFRRGGPRDGPRDHRSGGGRFDRDDRRGGMERYDRRGETHRRPGDRGNDRFGNFGRRDDRGRNSNNYQGRPSDGDRPPRFEKREKDNGVNGSKKEKEAVSN